MCVSSHFGFCLLGRTENLDRLVGYAPSDGSEVDKKRVDRMKHVLQKVELHLKAIL